MSWTLRGSSASLSKASRINGFCTDMDCFPAERRYGHEDESASDRRMALQKSGENHRMPVPARESEDHPMGVQEAQDEGKKGGFHGHHEE